MNQESTQQSNGKGYRVIRERLKNTTTDLAKFSFGRGGNIYVLSYNKDGQKKHILIDSGDTSLKDQLIPTLNNNGVDVRNIEKIILTHHHLDHCGLASSLARESGATIVAHSSFKDFVEGRVNAQERQWMGNFNTSQFNKCNIEYLSPNGEKVTIAGVKFPSLGNPIELGERGRLYIWAPPVTTQMHSPDQLVVFYSARTIALDPNEMQDGFRPTDDILFSGDLWLMVGPLFQQRMLSHLFFHLRMYYFQFKFFLKNGRTTVRNAREQDWEAKEALKHNFYLVRVEPGHGDEFIGSRIIPFGLLTDSDLLVELGYSADGNKSILKQKELAAKKAELNKRAYANFVRELALWKQLGYSSPDISGLLVRIYQEQTGGPRPVALDRKQRRIVLKATLSRLLKDPAASDELHQIAESTLSYLRKV